MRVATLPQGRTLPAAQWERRHRGMLALLWAHAAGLPVIALLYGMTLGESLLEGVLVAAFAIAAMVPRHSARRTRAVVVALGLLSCSALLVHITGGLIEAHFHFFVMVGVLSLYEDWVPFGVAVGYVLLQHGLMATVIPGEHVFNHAGPAWKWSVIHSAFIGALCVALVVNWRAVEQERLASAEIEQRQRSVLESLQDGVVVYDERERITYLNPAAEEILGVPRDTLAAGSRSWEPLGADGRPMPDEERPVARTARTGEPCRGVDVGLRRADGGIRWTTVATQALRASPDAPPPHGVVVAFTDITERREALDALERSNAELAQFAYVASHDLSEPLRMVSSYLQLLRRRYHGQIDEDADEFIDFAVEGANRMRALIEDLLAYSRAGRASDPRPVDLGQVMADVLSSLAAAVADARAQLHVRPLPSVLGDPIALAQLMQNLVANALKFRRGARASVWVDAERDDAGMWRVSVADDGIGIDPRHRERVFKMFQRLHGRESFEGTGIGLAICRKLVERQGGRIWVEDREGGGTVFSFTVPAVPTPTVVPAGIDAGDERAARGAVLPA